MKIPPQILRDSKQKKGTPSEKERLSSGQNRNPSVVFLWSNGKIAAVKTAAISILVDPRRIELPNLSDANEQSGIVCACILPFLMVSTNNYFAFRPHIPRVPRTSVVCVVVIKRASPESPGEARVVSVLRWYL